jgi:hypothetical protein
VFQQRGHLSDNLCVMPSPGKVSRPGDQARITAVKPLMESVVVYWRLGGDERFLRWNYASHGNE